MSNPPQMILPYFVLYGTFVVTRFVLLPVVVSMLLHSMPVLYIASHHSLKQKEIDPVTGKMPKVESIGGREAVIFPILASGAIVTLYLIYKYFPLYWVNFVLSSYLGIFGIFAVARSISPMLLPVVNGNWKEAIFARQMTFPKYLNYIDESLSGTTQISANRIDIVCAMVGVMTTSGWLLTKNWSLHNLLAICFAIQAIQIVSVGSFKIAAGLLIGLFFYDILFVFGTTVMITVAKSFDGPAKILFPTKFEPLQFSLLGLGDIVLPGLLIAMTLRFDRSRHNGEGPFPKPIFHATFFAHAAALIVTSVVMKITNHPQPALLYLVPACLLACVGGAYWKGVWRSLWVYNEEKEKDE